jgi:UPF0755 protein
MDDFRRPPVNRLPQQPRPQPVQPPQQPSVPQSTPVQSPPLPPPTPVPAPISDLPPKKPRKSRKKIILWAVLGFIVGLLLVTGGVLAWYSVQLSPVDAQNTDKKLVKIESGLSPNGIATLLEGEGVIRSATAFLWYTRLEGVQNTLQAGSYRLSPSESTSQIVDHLVSGKVDTFSITFLPGATLADDRKAFIAAGYSEEDVDTALRKTYDSPLFSGKPADADLEGYIYGETYSFGTDATVEDILTHVFDQFYDIVQKNNLEALFRNRGLTLYEGVTLASIIQREASPAGDDMAQIAQVFYSRLAVGMALGSDVTYQYIADKTGVARDPNLDSPYNTRRYTGLPPGPISAPGEKALIAAANPAAGDYLYFLSGDDDVTYFARTNDEHEANIQNHCQKKCQIL